MDSRFGDTVISERAIQPEKIYAGRFFAAEMSAFASAEHEAKANKPISGVFRNDIYVREVQELKAYAPILRSAG